MPSSFLPGLSFPIRHGPNVHRPPLLLAVWFCSISFYIALHYILEFGKCSFPEPLRQATVFYMQCIRTAGYIAEASG